MLRIWFFNDADFLLTFTCNLPGFEAVRPCLFLIIGDLAIAAYPDCSRRHLSQVLSKTGWPFREHAARCHLQLCIALFWVATGAKYSTAQSEVTIEAVMLQAITALPTTALHWVQMEALSSRCDSSYRAFGVPERIRIRSGSGLMDL